MPHGKRSSTGVRPTDGLDGQLATVRHRIARIQHQVEQRRLEERGVAQHGQVGFECQNDTKLLRQDLPQDAGQILDRGTQHHPLGGKAPGTAQRQHTGGHDLRLPQRAMGLLEDLCDLGIRSG
jgi:hypothetical protein